MRKKTIELYQFKELSKEAQEKTIEQYRDINTDFDWSDYMLEDLKNDNKKLGYDIDDIFWSGFYSQGDGACFIGSVDVSKWIKAQKLGNQYRKLLNYTINNNSSIEIEHFGHYYHSNCMSFRDYIIDFSNENEQLASQGDEVFEMIKAEAIEKADQFYKEIEKACDYLMSDEAVAETLEINEYEFLKEGGNIQ